MCVFTYGCMYLYLMRVCMIVSVYVRMLTRMSVCMYACMYELPQCRVHTVWITRFRWQRHMLRVST